MRIAKPHPFEMSIEEDNVKVQFWTLKRRFREFTRELYPGVEYPEILWLFEQALGIDPRQVVQAPIRKDSYLQFVLDGDGKRRTYHYSPHKLIKNRVRFTNEQKKIVKEWWPLLPQSMLDEG